MITNNKVRYKTEVRNNSFAFFTEDSFNNGIHPLDLLRMEAGELEKLFQKLQKLLRYLAVYHLLGRFVVEPAGRPQDWERYFINKNAS